jgi:outer membrane protein OmpA-like peptidoglycan-associated protein
MKASLGFGACAIVLAATWCISALAQDESASQLTGAGDQVIHLHMPIRHVRRRTSTPEVAPSTVDAIGAGPATPPLSVKAETSAAPQAETKTTSPARPRTAGPSQPAIPFNFGDDDSATPSVATPPPALKTASLPPRAAESAHAAPRHVAPADQHLSKRGAVLFDKGVSDPSAVQFNGVKVLASDLASALESGASRIELEAFAGAPGDKSTDARRLSLKRALAVRQLLIDDGVPSNRIDVRAMGGVDDKGPADRVDVFIRAG